MLKGTFISNPVFTHYTILKLFFRLTFFPLAGP